MNNLTFDIDLATQELDIHVHACTVQQTEYRTNCKSYYYMQTPFA